VEVGKITADVDNPVDTDVIELVKTFRGVELELKDGPKVSEG